MGLGNFLFVHKEVNKEFIKNIKDYIDFKVENGEPIYQLHELYVAWLYGALAALKYDGEQETR